MKNLLLLLLFFSQICIAEDFDSKLKKFDRTNNYDVIHYKLDIHVNLDSQKLGGIVSVILSPKSSTDSISFDAENMNITKVTAKNKIFSFIHQKNKLHIKLDKHYNCNDTLTIDISYECKPGSSKGIKYFKPSPSTTNNIYQCWTQGEEELNHFWFPCYDFPNDRVTSELIVTVNDKFETISNGQLLSVSHDQEKHTKTFHWLQNKRHVAYLVSLVIGEYAIVNDKYGKIPMPSYVYKGMEEDAKRIFPQTKEMISYFEKKTGIKYPWAKYSQTLLKDFFGGMENTSATNLIDAFPDRKQYIYDEKYSRFYTTLIAHELAHMWYGDLITCSNWAHLWLNEGFAEFFPGAYYEEKYGKDISDQYYHNELESFLSIDKKEKMPSAIKESNNIYPKGALIIKMLRHELGDNLFWKAIKDYSKTYKDNIVTTKDFQSSLENSTGKNFDLFFKQWVYKAGYPIFNIKYNYDSPAKILKIEIIQTQKQDSLTGLFDVNSEIEIITKNKSIKKSVHISKEKEFFEFGGVDEPLSVIFDPSNKIIKEVIQNKPASYYLYQLNYKSSILPRIEAVIALKKYADSLPVFNALTNALSKEKSVKVKNEIIEALGNSTKSETVDILIKTFKDNDPAIRRNVIFNISKFKSDPRVSILVNNALFDSSNTVASSAIRNLVYIDSIKALNKIIACLEIPSSQNTIQENALGAMIKLRDSCSIPYFMKYSVSGKSQLARNSSLLGLTTMAKDHPYLYDYFISQLKHENSYFRKMSVNALSVIGNRNAIKPLEELQKMEKNQNVLRNIKEALKELNDK